MKEQRQMEEEDCGLNPSGDEKQMKAADHDQKRECIDTKPARPNVYLSGNL